MRGLVILFVINRVVVAVLRGSRQVVDKVVRQATNPCCSVCLPRLRRQQA